MDIRSITPLSFIILTSTPFCLSCVLLRLLGNVCQMKWIVFLIKVWPEKGSGKEARDLLKFQMNIVEEGEDEDEEQGLVLQISK